MDGVHQAMDDTQKLSAPKNLESQITSSFPE